MPPPVITTTGSDGNSQLSYDLADEPGSLPMLQEALVLLWGTMSGRLLTRASYDTLGHDGRSGLAMAMATKADATLASLPPDQQRIARRIFLRLVQFGEGRPDTRRQLGVDELRAASDDTSIFDALIQLLIKNRLLTPSLDETRKQRLDIAHEMLIVGWPASREWVESRREAEKSRRRLTAKAEEWVRLGRGESGLLDRAELAETDAWLKGPDAIDLGIDLDVSVLAEANRKAIESRKRAQRRRTRLAIGALTSALLVISTLAVWGEFKRRDADTQRMEALAQKKRANDSKTVADSERVKAISQKKSAERLARISNSQELAALSALDRNRRLDRSLLLAVESIRTADTLEARRSLYEAVQHQSRIAFFLHVNEGDVTSAMLSPDGKTLAVGFGLGSDGGVML